MLSYVVWSQVEYGIVSFIYVVTSSPISSSYLDLNFQNLLLTLSKTMFDANFLKTVNFAFKMLLVSNFLTYHPEI